MGYKTVVVTRKDRCDQMPGNKKSQEEMKGGGRQRMLFITRVGRDD